MKITKKEIFNIISKSLNLKSQKLDEKTKSKDLEQWDSLGQLSIITSLDKKLKGSVNLDGIASATSVKQILEYLKKKKILS
jgi:acyl carrier protein